MRKLVLFIVISIAYVLQTTVFQYFDFANISPDLLIIITASFGFMRGKREGIIVGFCCGLLLDIFFGSYLGIYALIYMYIGYANGFFQKWFYPDDFKLPFLLIVISDLIKNIFVYFLMFLFRRRFQFGYYMKSIIIPELVYTTVIALFLYWILLKINQKVEVSEKRRAKKFDL